jgi:hypothetical protein
MVGRYRAHVRVAVVVALATSACAAIEGLGKYSTGPGDGGTTDGPNVVDDATAGTDGPSGEAGLGDGAPVSDVQAPVSDVQAPVSDVQAPVSDVQAPVDVVVTVPEDAPSFDAGVCGVTMVDLVHGVFVAPPPGGVDSAGCGTSPSSPCASIGQGLMTATIKTDAGARNIVYVAGGPTGGPVALPYVEKVTLPANVTVQGGWHWAAGGSSEWTFDCGASPESVVTVQAPSADNMTVIANSNNGTSTLSTLTVLSKATASPGESLYGIFATGANTQLTLTDVVVTMQQGGTGPTGTNASAAAAAASSCSSGDGNSMTVSGSAGTAGAGASVSSTGFATHTGGMGSNGTPGDNGTAGQPAAPVSYPACVKAPPACMSGQAMCTGAPGVNGCGGGVGLAGTGGGGGGSSVAVFAYDAMVTITAGVLQAGNGGTGGAGGTGSLGAIGSSGAPGQQTICAQSTCASSSLCMVTGTTTAAAGGTSGGTGGQGSNGGQGGGGAGGDSYSILTGGMATTRLTLSPSAPPLLAAGQPGASGMPNGAAGASSTNTGFP